MFVWTILYLVHTYMTRIIYCAEFILHTKKELMSRSFSTQLITSVNFVEFLEFYKIKVYITLVAFADSTWCSILSILI